MKTILPEGIDTLDQWGYFYDARDFDRTVEAVVSGVITPETVGDRVGDRHWELRFKHGIAEKIRGIVPLSETGFSNDRTLGFFVGQTVGVKVQEIDKENGLVACSRRTAVEEMRRKMIEEVAEGEGLAALVRFVGVNYVGLDIGGGVIVPVPFAEAAFSLGVPLDVLYEVGQLVDVVIDSIDKENSEIKIKLEDPWEEVKLNRGDMVLGKVVKGSPERLYVRVKGVVGLASNEGEIKVGESRSFQVTSIDKAQRKLRLKVFAVERIRGRRKIRARREREKKVQGI